MKAARLIDRAALVYKGQRLAGQFDDTMLVLGGL